MSKYKLHQGDCLSYMKSMPDNYVDAIITDPPYGLKFMGKKWDYDVPKVEIWQECYRILKPGGHLLSFAGTRTYHRLVIKIEDAGFEIRDMIAWIYGQGFPKSHNISKALDKMAGAEREIIGKYNPTNGSGKGFKSDKYCGTIGKGEITREDYITAPATEEAKQWDGWGTALKPAIEPICLARKPLEGTVAENILKYGTGGINIDECRIKSDEINPSIARRKSTPPHNNVWEDKRNPQTYAAEHPSELIGRFPANVIHDGSEEVIAEFPQSNPTKPHPVKSNVDKYEGYGNITHKNGEIVNYEETETSAARFFYCAKASKKDRDEGLDDLEEKRVSYMNTHNGNPDEGEEWQPVDDRTGKKRNRFAATMRNNHPTVKPTNLMRYLCKLITPPNGIIIDPFMGSGSTGKAARLEGFRFIGCETDEGYFEIAKRRIAHELD